MPKRSTSKGMKALAVLSWLQRLEDHDKYVSSLQNVAAFMAKHGCFKNRIEERYGRNEATNPSGRTYRYFKSTIEPLMRHYYGHMWVSRSKVQVPKREHNHLDLELGWAKQDFQVHTYEITGTGESYRDSMEEQARERIKKFSQFRNVPTDIVVIPKEGRTSWLEEELEIPRVDEETGIAYDDDRQLINP